MTTCRRVSASLARMGKPLAVLELPRPDAPAAAPRGNTSAPTIAVAERAAALIRGTALLAPARLVTALAT